MKQISSLFFLIFICLRLNAQIGNIIYTDSNNFESPNFHLVIDSSQIGNLWQIGKPVKPIFNAAYSPTHAIVTDTLNNTTQNNLSSFTLKFLPNYWGSGKLTFRHQYDMDSIYAGGYIDISYNLGINWENIVNDTNWLSTFTTNIYGKHDTISGNIPAFTGSSNGWQLSEFAWIYDIATKWGIPFDTVFIRFNFKSNSTAISKEGWMIDNITFNGYDVVGKVEIEKKEMDEIQISPNPTSDLINIESKVALKSICIYSCEGNLVYKSNINKKHSMKISMNAFKQGIYYIKTIDIEGKTGFNKIVKTL
ncbi:MAG: T9SS type A sorting domain-containing protein [Bacteroidetes bacterium]|nr:T9SS type A sorting domain-containing protein [Bacteroidota bacterium]